MIVKQFFALLAARVKRRIVYAVITAIATGTIAVLSKWLGIPSRYNPLNYPHPFSQIWWYFPVGAAIGFVLILLMPSGFDKDLGL
jgi:hypothetical protein